MSLNKWLLGKVDENDEDEYILDITDLITTKKCLCEYSKGYDIGFDVGIDTHWDWTRTALFKIIGKSKLVDTMFIQELQNAIENLTPKEVKEFLEME
ncbi:hypothetical protein LCGC14_1955690 [marine sediment metagenome]|uniref:Uncharacterized protein n=1 Tax=marine sediment metagenome TaxID=412755 RepID=A0A0F9G4J4_9ZZZZ